MLFVLLYQAAFHKYEALGCPAFALSSLTCVSMGLLIKCGTLGFIPGPQKQTFQSSSALGEVLTVYMGHLSHLTLDNL